MITFSEKSTRESYLHESEGVRINGEVNYNGNGFTATMSISLGSSMGYGNINLDGSINLSGFKSEQLEAASKAVDAFYKELKSAMDGR